MLGSNSKNIKVKNNEEVSDFSSSESGMPGKKESKSVFDCQKLSIFYGDFCALQDFSMEIYEKQITALIGPSGCGKSSFLRTLNRMNDFIEAWRLEGQVFFRGEDIYSGQTDPVEVRLQIGMVFQSPNPFPKTVYENIALGPQLCGYRGNIQELVESSLKQAYLWDEMKDQLQKNAYSLSGGQQQRLCIARSIAMQPNVLLMDEPTSALDPISTAKIEELILELKKKYTIIIVTHNMQQAARIGDFIAFFYQGKLIEYDRSSKIFNKPSEKLTEEYITGRFG